jgi:hypothetical protein
MIQWNVFEWGRQLRCEQRTNPDGNNGLSVGFFTKIYNKDKVKTLTDHLAGR